MSVNKRSFVKSVMDSGNYTPVPNLLWQVPISATAKSVFVFIISQGENWNPGMRSIADGVGISRNTIARAINELQAAGMIQIDQGAKGFRQVYTIQNVEFWKVEVAQNRATSGSK